MLLKTRIVTASKYTNQSKFSFWKNIQEGHTIEIAMKVEHLTRGQSGLHAPTISFENLNTEETFGCSLNEAVRYLEGITYKEQQ